MNNYFSVTIPTYGYGGKGTEFLEFNFEKLRIQTFKDFEVIISDHSIDDTIEKVCSDWSDKLNLKYFKNDNGRGIISPNINNAMTKASGKYIKVLFQDDFLFDENSLEVQKNFIETKENFKWLMTKFYHSDDGHVFYRLFLPVWNNQIWTGYNTMGCPSGLTLKNDNLIFFDENLNWLMDCDYYKRLYDLYGEPCILDEITYVNRTWGHRLTDTIGQELKDKEFIIVNNKYARTQ